MLATGRLTLNDVLAHREAADAGRTALIWESLGGAWSEHTFGALGDDVARLAGGLRAAGVGRGDRVVVHMANRPQFIQSLFALARLGAVAVPTIALYAPDELRYVLDHAAVKGVLCDPGRQAVAQRAAADAAGWPWVRSTEAFDELLAASPVDAVDVSPDDVALIMYSSGTTARPKGVMLTHQALVLSGEMNAQHERLTPGDRSLCVLPLFHVNAMCISMLACMVTGSALVLAEGFHAGRYWAQVRAYAITVGSLVANPIKQLLALPEEPSDDRHCLRLMLYGMPLTTGEIETFERRFEVPLVNLWGMTENAATGTRMPLYLPRPGTSIGLPMLGSDLRVFTSSGHDAGDGPGEARFAGGPVTAGYHADEAATAAARAGERFRTGDVMAIDARGYLHFVDREKDVIKVKGENVSSAEVERVLTDHDTVTDAAVVGLADERRDERIVAFVIPANGARPSVDDLRAFCGERLARFKVPHEIRFVDELPRTSIGKIRKAQLRERLA